MKVDVVLAVGAGGAIGACLRFAAGMAWPGTLLGSSFPWATLLINVLGCLTMGALMAALLEGQTRHRLLRPFLGTGLLGGFTTFSAYALDTVQLIQSGHTALAVTYLLVTVLTAVGAVAIGQWLVRKFRFLLARQA